MALIDKDIIFLLKVLFPDGTAKYWSTVDITIGGNAYDSGVMSKDSLSYITKTIDVVSGGKYGGGASLSFEIPRDNVDSFTGDFHNSFYPATSKEPLAGTIVDFGWTYVGASTTIYWLHQFSGMDVKVDYDVINVSCYETNDLNKVNIPAYVYQKDNESRLGYIKDYSPDELVEVPIPILYGDFRIGFFDEDSVFADQVFGMAPIHMVDIKDARLFVACHDVADMCADYDESSSQKSNFFRYEQANDIYQKVICIEIGSTSVTETLGNASASGTVVYTDTRIDGEIMNGDSISNFIMLDRTVTGGMRLAGELIIPLRSVAEGNTASEGNASPDIGNVLDNDITNYEDIDTATNNQMILTMKGSPNTDDIGYIFGNDAEPVLNPLTEYAHGWVEVAPKVSSGDVKSGLVYKDSAGTTQLSDHFRTITSITAKYRYWHYCGMWWNSGFSATGGSKDETKMFNEVSELEKYAWRISGTNAVVDPVRVYRAWYHFHYMDVKISVRYKKRYSPVEPPERSDYDLQSVGQVY